MAGNVVADANNLRNLGSSTAKWRSVYTVNLFTNDTIFSNNFRLTEPSNSSIAFKDSNHNTLLTIADNSIESSKPFRVSLETGEPFVCDSTREGFMYFDSSNKKFKGCNGNSWVSLG